MESEPPDESSAPSVHPGPSEPSAPRTSLPAGARCALHPEVDADALCARCGNYMCRTCSQDGASTLCEACVERGAGRFPFSREHYDLEGLLNYSFTRFKACWVSLVVATVIFAGAYVALTIVTTLAAGFGGALLGDQAEGALLGIQIVGQVIQVLTQLWLQMGMIAIVIEALEGREPDLSLMWSQLRRLPAALLTTLALYALIAAYAGIVAGVAFALAEEGETLSWTVFGIGGALGVIPFASLGLGLSFTVLVLVHEPDASAIGAMVRSFRIAQHKRLSILGYLLVAGVISLAGFLACCVGTLASMPLATMLFAGLYLALSRAETPAGAPGAISADALPPPGPATA